MTFHNTSKETGLMSNVALYLRKSRDEENESRDVTLARHERMLKEYCERNDLIIKKIYK